MLLKQVESGEGKQCYYYREIELLKVMILTTILLIAVLKQYY